MVKILKNPLFISSLLIALFIYSGIVKIKNRAPLRTLAKKSEIICLEGCLSSNPVKTSFFGSSYRAEFSVSKTFTRNGFFSASGKTDLYFPQELVESYYPGKLYTSLRVKSDSGLLVEDGAKLSVDVEYINKFSSYVVKSGKSLGWEGNVILSWFRRFRAICRLQFKRLMYGWKEAGGFLLALLSGSREYTEKSVSDAFRDSGLSHILALSGMHLGLFGSIAHFFGKKARGRNFADALQLAAVTFFVWFAGVSPSLLRAFLAALILYLNSLLRMNRPEPLTLLSACFIIQILIFPEHAFESAFMLSYSSLGGIILFSMFFRKIYPYFIPFKTRLSLADSTAAQIATCPVSLKIFGKIMPVGIVASLFVSPLVFLFLYLGLFGVVICLALPFLSGAFCGIMNALYFLIKRIVLIFGSIRGIEF